MYGAGESGVIQHPQTHARIHTPRPHYFPSSSTPIPPAHLHQPHPALPAKALQDVVWIDMPLPGVAEPPTAAPTWDPVDKPAKGGPELPPKMDYPEWQMGATYPGAVDDGMPFVFDDVSKKKKGDFDADNPMDPLEDDDPALWGYILPDSPDARGPVQERWVGRGRQQPHGMGPEPGRWRAQAAPRRSRWMEMHMHRVTGSQTPSVAASDQVWPEDHRPASTTMFMTNQNPLSGQQSWMHRPSWLPETRVTQPPSRLGQPGEELLRNVGPPPQALQVCRLPSQRRA